MPRDADAPLLLAPSLCGRGLSVAGPDVCLGVRFVRKNELAEVELLDQKMLLNLDADK